MHERWSAKALKSFPQLPLKVRKAVRTDPRQPSMFGDRRQQELQEYYTRRRRKKNPPKGTEVA